MDAVSIVTSSAAPGTDAPPAPPDVADQLAVVVASQVFVPPTQNLAAMFTPAKFQQRFLRQGFLRQGAQ